MSFNKFSSYAQAASYVGPVNCPWAVGDGWGATYTPAPPTNVRSLMIPKIIVTPPSNSDMLAEHHRLRGKLPDAPLPPTRTESLVECLLRGFAKQERSELVWDRQLGGFIHRREKETTRVRNSGSGTARSQRAVLRAQRDARYLKHLNKMFQRSEAQPVSEPPREPLHNYVRGIWERSVAAARQRLAHLGQILSDKIAELRLKRCKAIVRLSVERRLHKLTKTDRMLGKLISLIDPVCNMAYASAQAQMQKPKTYYTLSTLDQIPMIACNVPQEGGQIGDVKNVTMINPVLSGDSKVPDNINVKIDIDDKHIGLFKSLVDSSITKVFSGCKEKVCEWGDKSIQVILALTGAVASRSKVTWLTSTLSVLHTLGVYDARTLTDLLSASSDAFTGVGELVTSVGNILPGENGQMPRLTDKEYYRAREIQKWTRFATFAWQGMGMALSLKGNAPPKNLREFGDRFMRATQDQARCTNGFLSFFKNMVEVFQDLLYALIEWWKPELRDIAAGAKYDIYMNTFMSEYTTLRTVMSGNFVWTQNLANRVNACIISAQMFLRLAINQEDLVPSKTLSIIHRSYDWLLQKRTEASKQGFSAITRYTPFCIYVFGAVGVGKSECVTGLTGDLLEALEIKDCQNPVFVKPSVAEYFTNCSDQPIVQFDDFEQITHNDPTHSDAGCLIFMKSSAPFNPPMAAVEDKYLMYSPKAIIACSNIGWPKPHFISEPKALWRRRDILVEMVLKEGVDLAKIREKQVDPPIWDHVIFRVYKDPVLENSSYTDMTHSEFKAYVKRTAKKYNERESQLLKARLEKINKVLDEPQLTCTQEGSLKLMKFTNHVHEAFMKELNECGSAKIKKVWHKMMQMISRNPVPACVDVKPLIDSIAEDVPSDKELRSKVKELFTDEEIDLDNIDYSVFSQEVTPLSIMDDGMEELKKLGEDDTPLLKEIQVEVDVHTVTGKSSAALTSAPKENAQMPDVKGVVEQPVDLGVECPTKLLPTDTEGITCVHDDVDLFNTRYDVIDNKLYVYKDKKKTGKTFPILPCENDCVCKKPLIAVRVQLHFARSKLLIRSRNIGKDTIIEYKYEDSFRTRCRRAWASIKESIPKAVKWIIKIVKIALVVLVAVIAVAGVILGLSVTTAAVGSYFTQDGDSNKSLKDCYKEAARDTATLAAHHIKDDLEYRDAFMAAVNNAKREEAIKSMLLDEIEKDATKLIASQGQNNPYTVEPKHNAKSQKNVVPVKGQAQTQRVTAILNMLKRNTFFLTVVGTHKHTGSKVISTVRGFGMFHTWALIPRHYIWAWQDINIERLTYINRNVLSAEEISLNVHSITRVLYPGRELCAIKIPGISSFRSVLKHFYTANDWKGAVRREIMLLEIDESNNVIITEQDMTIYKEFVICMDDAKLDTIGPVMRYDRQAPGMCMAIALSVSGKIMGFHIAGGKSGGYAEPVVYESYVDMPGADIDEADLKEIFCPFEPVQSPALQIDSSVQVFGKVPDKYKRYETGKTNFIPSRVHKVFPIVSVPAPLRACKENGFTNPLAEGVRKHGLPCKGFNVDILEQARKRLTSQLINKVPPVFQEVRIWSETEACNGVEAIPGLQAVVLKTSEGFPYCFERPHLPKGTPAKQWLLNRVDRPDGNHEYDFHPRLRSILDLKDELRKKRISPRSIFVDCLKDARLPVDKAYTPGKVRIFSISPLDYIIQYRQYFADFIAAYVTSRMHHAIGIAPERLDWNDLALNLQSKGTKILCGDYSNFGPAFAKDVHEAVNTSILEWHSEHGATKEENGYREILMHEVLHAVHLASDNLYEVPCGMPSGSPETTCKNSLVNTLYIYYIWIYIWHQIDIKMATLDSMLAHIFFVTYGDDVIINVSDDAAIHFNNETLQKAFAEHGVKYTDDTKSGEIRKWCTLSEASFLKRSFKKHPMRSHVVMSACDLNIARDVANWVTKTSPDEFVPASLEASYQALALCYGNGRQIYDETVAILARKWRQCGVRDFTPRTWQELDNLYYGDPHSGFVSWLSSPYTHVERSDCVTDVGQMELMETPVGGNVITKTEDTVLETHDVPVVVSDPDIGVTTAILATTDRVVTLPKLTDRQIVLGNYQWKTSHSKGSTIVTWDLPNDGIVNSIKAPNWRLIRSFAYYRPKSITLNFSLNANKFSVGQLQISAIYDYHLDDKANLRDNVYSRSTTLHALLDAGSSNSATLVIPYKHFNPWLCSRKLTDFDKFVNVKVMVLNPLATPDTVASVANLVVTWTLDDCEMMGMRPDIDLEDDAQMFPMAAAMAMQYLNNRFADKNRDKPPVQLNPTTLEPRATGVLAYGTNTTEAVSALRLDARAQVPHPDTVNSEDSIYHICGVYGLLTQLQWKKDQGTGTNLYQIPTGPLLPKDKYAGVQIPTVNIDRYMIPPVGVVASCFDQYSGGVKYRFDIVGSMMHTGSLMVVFVPGYTKSDKLTYQNSACYAYNVIYDIHEQRSFEFEVPYVASQPWWPVFKLNDAIYDRVPGYGTIALFVVNPLVPMANVAANVDINVYMAGAPSLRFSIPVAPQLALSWYPNSVVPPKPELVRAKVGYYPYICGTTMVGDWSEHPRTCILRYGDWFNHYAQFDGLEIGSVANGNWYYYESSVKEEIYKFGGDVRYSDNMYYVAVDIGDGYGHIYLTGFQKSQPLSIIFGSKKYTGTEEPDYSRCVEVTDSNWEYWGSGNPAFIRHEYTPARIDIDYPTSDEGQMSDPRAETTGLVQPASITRPMLEVATYGEDFSSVKNLLRRYEYITTVSVKRTSNGVYNDVGFAFFGLPQGYGIDISNPTQSVMRDGMHALLLSGYRYFRGSMNFKFVCTNTSGAIWAQHRPNRSTNTTYFVKKSAGAEPGVYANGYASAISAMGVNPILTINVPYYNPSSFLLLQFPKNTGNYVEVRAMSLGEILVGVNTAPSDTSERIDVHVYGALGDDGCQNLFYGFPPVILQYLFNDRPNIANPT